MESFIVCGACLIIILNDSVSDYEYGKNVVQPDRQLKDSNIILLVLWQLKTKCLRSEVFKFGSTLLPYTDRFKIVGFC